MPWRSGSHIDGKRVQGPLETPPDDHRPRHARYVGPGRQAASQVRPCRRTAIGRRAIIRHPMSEAPDSGSAEPFWERAYQDDGADAFGRPSSEIVSLAERLPEAASVLDAGCGEGRNARFLAARGFRVDAFDVSAAGIDKLTRMAARDGVHVNAWTDDLNSFRYSRCYDLIISHGVLHLLERDVWSRVIAQMQAHTRPGGANVVAVFTDEIAPPDDLAPFVRGLFKAGELAGRYANWRQEQATSYVLEDEHPGGVRHRHAIDKVVAWKE